ncbi:F-box/LRR-repeat protein At5g02910-like [Bidens hawaiensis]|uniref:F-box/LRR-repeat protein At5g02910-like n=1 Tax=Bidens hawaiensis TaxID=980011 RepID=UPI00404A7E11
MDSRIRNVDNDRLSNLPGDLIHKILARMDTKHAVRTSTLSSRWRYIWTSMPNLYFSDEHFNTHENYLEFVKGVLSARNNQIQVSSVTLAALGRVANKALVNIISNIILNYAASHNVQQLTLRGITMTSSARDLLALTTLNLKNVKLYDDNSAGLFSDFVNLKNLTLNYCTLKRRPGSKFNICHPGLSNLTLEGCCSPLTVVTPQLKNLIIKNREGIHVISAPDLASLRCEGHYYPLQLPADLLHLEKVEISSFRPFDVFAFNLDLPSDDKANAHKIVSLLQQLHIVKFLTLNMEIIEILFSSVELISHLPSPFANLKSLKIHRKIYSTQKEQTQPEVTMCTEVKNYLFDGSPGATFTMVSHDQENT